jgi:protein TonB
VGGVEGGVVGGVIGGVKGGTLGGVIGGTLGGTLGGTIGGTLGGVLGGVPGAPPPPAPPPPKPPPPPPPPPKPQDPIRVGGDVLQANCIKCPAPEYPSLARTARVSDTVVLTAVVSKDGTVKYVRVIRGHQLLQQAALDAVRQWRYKPQELNGEKVEVTASISISFVFK